MKLAQDVYHFIIELKLSLKRIHYSRDEILIYFYYDKKLTFLCWVFLFV